MVMNKNLADRLAAVASEAASLRSRNEWSGQQASKLDALKAWQSARLARTHADLLGHTRYRPAALFFLEDLYEPKDARWRDAELARIIPTLGKYLPEAALSTLVDAVELDLLSERLDARVAALLPDGEPITEAGYAAAYRGHRTPQERQTQLRLMLTVGQSLDRLVSKPLVSGLLAAMGPVAHAAGLGAIHGFLQRGFAAFKSMRGAQGFLDLLSAREALLMQRLFEGMSQGLLEQGEGQV